MVLSCHAQHNFSLTVGTEEEMSPALLKLKSVGNANAKIHGAQITPLLNIKQTKEADWNVLLVRVIRLE